LNDPTWIRSHLCDETINDRNQLFRVNTDKAEFYTGICGLNDSSLVNLVTYVSSNIDFNMVRTNVCFFC
jgi:hypothetical protein